MMRRKLTEAIWSMALHDQPAVGNPDAFPIKIHLAGRRVARSETIAFVSPSGAGKTSLVKLLVGLYRPKSGHIFYNGTPEDQVAIEDLRERIGFVTQDTQLFSGSIRENQQFVRPDATDEECLEVLRQAAVEGLLLRANHGLDSKIGEGGVKVSGGEKQRLSIARALLRRPQLLVFDEATSSLDSLTEEEISETIRDVAVSRDAITILIAHRLSTILHADCIYVLERGRIVESGRHEDLLASKGLYSAMWRQQGGGPREVAQPCVTDGTFGDPGLTFPANLLGARPQPTRAHPSQFVVHSRCTRARDCVAKLLLGTCVHVQRLRG